MNKQDLISAVAEGCGFSKSQSEEVINSVFGGIEQALAQGDTVRIAGFGTWRRVATKARTARNPRTGEVIEVPAKQKIKFKAASGLKE